MSRILFLIIFLGAHILLCSCRKASNHSKGFRNGTEDVEENVELQNSETLNGDSEIGIELQDESLSGNTDEVNASVFEKEDDSYLLPYLKSNKSSQILHRIGYVTSYNSKTKNANWVAWCLTKEHTEGPYKRDGIPYMVDEDVNGPRQELEDWQGHDLAIDHGHLCPAGDNKWDKEAMEQTFLLTNMCPQNSELNRGDWEYLEKRCRGWARHYGEIYIVAGPIFYTNNYKTIGNRVGVPDAFFKVILCMKKPKALGFVYPNIGDHHELGYYVKSVAEVETLTGIDFFYNLPDSIENVVEAEADIKKW